MSRKIFPLITLFVVSVLSLMLISGGPAAQGPGQQRVDSPLAGLGLGLAAENAPSGSTAPSLWVTPLSLDFGRVGVGDTSGQQAVTVNNVGSDTLTGFAGGGVNAPFSATQNCAGGVPPGGTCQYFFTFSPTASGTFSTTSNSGSNAGSFSVELRGEGVGARVHVSSPSLDFGIVSVGESSPQQAVTVHNTGLSTLTDFAGGGVNAPFIALQNCAGGVQPGGTCQYFFTFSPTANGLFTTTSNSGTNAGSFAIDLLGRAPKFIGPTSQRVTPRALDFGPVVVGSSGGTLTVNVTNQGYLYSISAFAGGAVNPPFGGSQNCAPSLAPGATCQFFYTFDPTETGVFTTTSNVSTSAGSFTIELRGEGVGEGLSVSPLVLDFGYEKFGVSQSVTVKNTGSATLSGFAGGGVDAPFSALQNCAGGVLPGGTCQFFYEFDPGSAFDLYTTTSNVSTNAGSFSILLIGGAKAPSLDLSFIPSQISPGDTATLQYTISNPNAGATLFKVTAWDPFPAGMSVAAPLLFSVSAECRSPAFSPSVGDTDIIFFNAIILSGDECVINLSVTAGDIGTYTHSLDVHAWHTGPSNTASATLSVGAILYLPIVAR